ncbi:hypothetical protein F5887DRAFT_1088625 [Amanita rubescens]|nr:hypothetical protein F5887DRAFT_1088625 [Amanita rubescens]
MASREPNPNEFEVLRWATAELLAGHWNEAYLNSLASIESLKQQNELLQQENQELHITAKVTEKLLDRMTTVTISRTGQSNACEPPATSVRQSNFPTSNLEMPPPLQKETFPDVRFWNQSAYTRWSTRQKGVTDGLSQQQVRRGRPSNASQNDEDRHPYIEDADGKPVGKSRLYNISKKARRLWYALDDAGLAPTSSTAMSEVAYDYYSREMLNHCFEFRLGDGNWKLDLWTSKNYSSWYQTNQKKRKRNDTVSSPSGSSNVTGNTSPSSSNGPSSSSDGTRSTPGDNPDDDDSDSNRRIPDDDDSDNRRAPGNDDSDNQRDAPGNDSSDNQHTRDNNSDNRRPGDDDSDNTRHNNDDGPGSGGTHSGNGSDINRTPEGTGANSGADSSANRTNPEGTNNHLPSTTDNPNFSGNAGGPTRITLRIRRPCDDMNEPDRMDKEAGTAGEGGGQGGESEGEGGEDNLGTGPHQSQDTERPSKRPKVLVPGTRKTAKNIARQQWLDQNPDGLEADFEKYYKSQRKKGNGTPVHIPSKCHRLLNYSQAAAGTAAPKTSTKAKSRQKNIAAALFAAGAV